MNSLQKFLFVDDHRYGSLRIVRVGLAVVAMWYFVSHFADAGLWFSSQGVLSSERISAFIETADLSDVTFWRFSPLYLLEHTALIRAYLLIGIAIAISSIPLQRSRIPNILLWLWVVWLGNRTLLISGPEELTLSFGLAYLATSRPEDDVSLIERPAHWSTCLSRRLMQVHLSILFAMTSLTMLSSNIWWDGTGSISIAAPTERRMLDLSNLLSSPSIHEPLTHAIVLAGLGLSIVLWKDSLRRYGMMLAIGWCAVLGLLSGQWMYLTTIAVMLQAFQSKAPKVPGF